ncbi:MAG: membrane protein insertase YidC [Lachnospiraceae bacterium]|nr:membrane protein insertase YidC [Bacillota bacterium]MBQ3579223.1 membrane protein insertase YidC [Bacillota bacterium]MBQ5360405.1 membrane protein insertase YidC [Lachnospiraceae bacterium]MBR0441208.1 membrane protein insertase YidC [Bacillota bacterium]
MKFLSTAIGYLLSAIYGLLDNYGLSIIILTLLVRLCLLPLYGKQIKETAKMSEIQPKMQEIQKRYAADPQTRDQKIAELYRDADVNPASGCLPLLIQMPFIIGLFALLRNPLTYMTQDSMIMAVHESFLWVPDLCQPDPWILPLIAGISTYFTFSATSQQGDASGMNNAMKYFYPVMIFLLGRSFPAGLALYWAVGNIFTIGQTVLFNKNKAKTKFKEEAEKEAKKIFESDMKKNQ